MRPAATKSTPRRRAPMPRRCSPQSPRTRTGPPRRDAQAHPPGPSTPPRPNTPKGHHRPPRPNTPQDPTPCDARRGSHCCEFMVGKVTPGLKPTRVLGGYSIPQNGSVLLRPASVRCIEGTRARVAEITAFSTSKRQSSTSCLVKPLPLFHSVLSMAMVLLKTLYLAMAPAMFAPSPNQLTNG